MIDWDAYRADYDAMSYPQLVEFHDRIWDLFPDQSKHSASLLQTFFASLSAEPTPVVEVGGWRGEAAAEVMAAGFPIERWDNFEMCRGATAHPVTEDPRYHGITPATWVWETPVDCYHVAVLAHVIEHMRGAQLEALATWLQASEVRAAYVEAPLYNGPRRWLHSTSSHVLEFGWNEVIALFARHGLNVAERHHYPPDRTVLFLRA